MSKLPLEVRCDETWILHPHKQENLVLESRNRNSLQKRTPWKWKAILKFSTIHLVGTCHKIAIVAKIKEKPCTSILLREYEKWIKRETRKAVRIQ